VKFSDLTLPDQFAETIEMDKLIHGLAADGTIRVMAAITTDIVREAVRRHQTSPTVSVALGRVLTGTLLLGSSLKEFDRLTVKIECDGAIEGLVAESNAQGKVRGYVRNPVAELLDNDIIEPKVNEIVGAGMFHVIREAGFDVGIYREPYHGSVPLYTSEIAGDFAYYLMQSEQIPSAVMLSVLLQPEEPFIKAAGGVMLQVMPGANEHIITMIEDTIQHAPNLTKIISEGATAEDLVKLVLGIIDYEILQEKEVEFKCNCSPERAVALISSLGKDEIESMLREDKGASMTCGFCNQTYRVDEAQLQEIIDSFL
jgi:molecular chaperone Hsp33